MATVWLLYLVLGAFAGVMAGLLGVGGGLVIVPVLSFIFAYQQLPPEHILHLALGTSLASIIFTSISSLRAHHARGAVNWNVVRQISPGIVFGTFLGSWVAPGFPPRFSKVSLSFSSFTWPYRCSSISSRSPIGSSREKARSSAWVA